MLSLRHYQLQVNEPIGYRHTKYWWSLENFLLKKSAWNQPARATSQSCYQHKSSSTSVNNISEALWINGQSLEVWNTWYWSDWSEFFISATVNKMVPIEIDISEIKWKIRETMFWMQHLKKVSLSDFRRTSRYFRSGLWRPIEVQFRPKIEKINAAVWLAIATKIRILIALIFFIIDDNFRSISG